MQQNVIVSFLLALHSESAKIKYSHVKFIKDNQDLNSHIASPPIMLIGKMHFFQHHFLPIVVKLDYISLPCEVLLFFFSILVFGVQSRFLY
jgi:hypothetical protein